MSSAFASMFSVAQAPLDSFYGEPVTIVPQLEDDTSEFFIRGADPTDAAYSVTGIFDFAVVDEAVKGSGANTHENVDVLTNRATVDFDEAVFVSNPMPQEGWIVVATSRPRQPRYTISAVEPDSISRVVCTIIFLDYAV